jgi:hypothetical protein
MISAEIGNTWAEEEKSGDHRLEAPQKEYLTVMVEDNVRGQNGRIIASKKFQIGRLKALSYEDRVSELRLWLAYRLGLNWEGS